VEAGSLATIDCWSSRALGDFNVATRSNRHMLPLVDVGNAAVKCEFLNPELTTAGIAARANKAHCIKTTSVNSSISRTVTEIQRGRAAACILLRQKNIADVVREG